MKISPRVSVVIPAYNAGSVIERAVLSVTSQNFPIHEILVYDDCSSDDTRDVLGDLASKHQHLVLMFGETNHGAGHARMELLKRAKGEFIAFLDADDVWHDTKLQKQIELMERTGAHLTYTGSKIVSSDGRVLGERRPPKSLSFSRLLLDNVISTSSAVVRNDLSGVREMPHIRRRQDYAYWIQLFQQNPNLKVLGLSEPLITYYRNEGSLSSNPLRNFKGNFTMFREVAGYSVVSSALLTLTNAVFRLLKV